MIIQEMISPEQCRAARGLLDWNEQELANKAAVGIVTVRQLEAGTHEPRRATLDVVRRAFEKAGVEFIEENGGAQECACESQCGENRGNDQVDPRQLIIKAFRHWASDTASNS